MTANADVPKWVALLNRILREEGVSRRKNNEENGG